jgi:hypothetical protein
MPHSTFLDWDEADQAKAIAYERWLVKDRCPRGHQITEWVDEHGKELRDPPFEAHNWLCPVCQMVGQHEEAEVKERDKDAPPAHGIYTIIKPLDSGPPSGMEDE